MTEPREPRQPYKIDIYPVGLLRDWRHRKMRLLRRALRYPLYQARRGNWRAVRNYFNGYLAEIDGAPVNCGRGWTKRTAERRVRRLAAAAGIVVGRRSSDG